MKYELLSFKKRTLSKPVNYHLGKFPPKQLNWNEIIPLSTRLVKESHKILMQNVRGQNKLPGEFRKTQNWIGAPGSPVESAKFIPVDVGNLLETMRKWEKYLHSTELDRLVQLALIHAEFEALHPFLDENGRLGRMIVPLFLYNKNLLKKPVFYISSYFEKNRDVYYEKLLSVSRNDNWTGFVCFFLEAIISQAQENQDKATAILQLYETKKNKIQKLTHSQYTIHALDFLFCRPVFSSNHFVTETEMSERTTKRILKILRENQIIKVIEEASGSRPARFVFSKLLNIVEGARIF